MAQGFLERFLEFYLISIKALVTWKVGFSYRFGLQSLTGQSSLFSRATSLFSLGAKVMSNDCWEKLKAELLKGFWTDSQVCHILAGLIETAEDGKYTCVEIEEEGRKGAKQDLRDKLQEIWKETEHKTEELEYYAQSFTKFWKTTYCVRWAKKKCIDIPWLDWAIKEGHISDDEKAS
jgi:hypothetical protein